MKNKLHTLFSILALFLFFSSVYGQENQNILEFDGNDSFYINDSGNNLDVNAEWTVELWLNVKNHPSGTFPVVLDRRTVFSLYLIADATAPTGDYAVRFVSRNSSGSIIASLRSDAHPATTMDYNAWYHVAVSRNAGTTRLFVNGVEMESSTDVDFALTNSTNALNIGARYWGSYDRYIDAFMDEVRLSDTGRYTSDFAVHTGVAPFNMDANTRLLLHMDEGAGTTLTDASGNFTSISLRTAPNNAVWQAWDFPINDLPLPVELTSFTAYSGNGMVTLNWVTSSEIDNQGYILLRSTSKEGTYSELDSYIHNADLKGAGNSSQEKSYQFVDYDVSNGTGYWYKLVDVDISGKQTIHNAIFATPSAENNGLNSAINNTLPKQFRLEQNYPNPFNPATHIAFFIPTQEQKSVPVQLNIFDLSGKKVRTLLNQHVGSGMHYTIKWDGKSDSHLPMSSGMYIYQLKTESYIQHKRMMLLK